MPSRRLWLWRWLPHRLSKRQSLSTATVPFRTTFTRTIKLNLLLKWLLSLNLSQSVNIVTWCRCLCFYEVSARFEYFYIIWIDSVIIRDKVGQNRSIDLQTASESAPNFTRKNKHTYILHRRIHNVMPYKDHLSVIRSGKPYVWIA